MNKDSKRLVIDLAYQEGCKARVGFNLRAVVDTVHNSLTTIPTPEYLSKIQGMEVMKGEYEHCVIRFLSTDHKHQSSLSVVISHALGEEETINVVFADASTKPGTSKTRHYQPMEYLGTMENKMQRSHHYSAMVTRLPVTELARDIFNYLYTGQLPAPFNQDLHKEFFQSIDKDRYKAAEGV